MILVFVSARKDMHPLSFRGFLHEPSYRFHILPTAQSMSGSSVTLSGSYEFFRQGSSIFTGNDVEALGCSPSQRTSHSISALS